MNAMELWPRKYIVAEDITQDVVLTIVSLQIEDLKGNGKEMGGVLYFREAKKGMVLKPTNGLRIIAMYGKETDSWTGKTITLYPSETDYNGKSVPCFRVREKLPEQQQPTAPVNGADSPESVTKESPQASGVGF